MPEQVLDWWATLWASPIAEGFADIDLPGLVRMARLWAKELGAGCSAAELGEIRQLESAYGLNPVARRRLLWRLEAAAPDAPTSQPSEAELQAKIVDLRSRLDRG